MPADFACASIPACEPDLTPPYYCAYHARQAGLPLAPGAIGVRAYGFRLAERAPDFAFAPSAEPGHRFATSCQVGRAGKGKTELRRTSLAPGEFPAPPEKRTDVLFSGDE